MIWRSSSTCTGVQAVGPVVPLIVVSNRLSVVISFWVLRHVRQVRSRCLMRKPIESRPYGRWMVCLCSDRMNNAKRAHPAAHFERAHGVTSSASDPRWRPRMLTFKGRKEDKRLVRGQGHYSSDWNLPGQLHASGFLRADHAHAVIRSSIDAAQRRGAWMVLVAVLATEGILADTGMSTLPPTVPYAWTRWRAHPDARAVLPWRANACATWAKKFVVVMQPRTNRQAMDATEQIYVEYEDLPAGDRDRRGTARRGGAATSREYSRQRLLRLRLRR